MGDFDIAVVWQSEESRMGTTKLDGKLCADMVHIPGGHARTVILVPRKREASEVHNFN